MQRQRITIVYDGQPVTTIDLAAAAHGTSVDTMGKIVRRAGLAPVPDRIGRMPLYLVADVERALRDRPGRGAPGVPRPHRPSEAETQPARHAFPGQ